MLWHGMKHVQVTVGDVHHPHGLGCNLDGTLRSSAERHPVRLGQKEVTLRDDCGDPKLRYARRSYGDSEDMGRPTCGRVPHA